MGGFIRRAVKDCQRAARRDFNNGLTLYKANREIVKLNERLAQIKLTRNKYKASSEALWNSSAYRVGRVLVKPMSIVKKLLRLSK